MSPSQPTCSWARAGGFWRLSRHAPRATKRYSVVILMTHQSTAIDASYTIHQTFFKNFFTNINP